MIPGLIRILEHADWTQDHDKKELYRLLDRNRSAFLPPEWPLAWSFEHAQLFPYNFEAGKRRHLVRYHLTPAEVEKHGRDYPTRGVPLVYYTAYCRRQLSALGPHLFRAGRHPSQFAMGYPSSREVARQRAREAEESDVCGHCVRALRYDTREEPGRWPLWGPARVSIPSGNDWHPSSWARFAQDPVRLYFLYHALRNDGYGYSRRERYQELVDKTGGSFGIFRQWVSLPQNPRGARAHIIASTLDNGEGLTACGRTSDASGISGVLTPCSIDEALDTTRDICKQCLRHYITKGDIHAWL